MDRSDLGHVARRASRSLGLSPLPPGTRPPPGAGMRRMLFAFVWLILGVIQVSIWFASRSWTVLGLAALWFALAAFDVVRARRLLQAEARSGPADEAVRPRSERDMDPS